MLITLLIVVAIFGLIMAAATIDPSERPQYAAGVVLALLVIVCCLSYGLALIGEPSSLWLWREILGVAV
jgi:hypothetical protein